MSSFKDMQLSVEQSTQSVKINDALTLEVRKYLPIKEKTDFLQFIVNSTLDENTGCFSPVRVNVYYSIAICRWYASIDFDLEDLEHIEDIFDALETNGIVEAILSAIPQGEQDFMNELVEETIHDIARYNSSAAGIIRSMSVNAGDLDSQLNSILEKVKDKEGIEMVTALKDMGKSD
jgi:hypothetical protein